MKTILATGIELSEKGFNDFIIKNFDFLDVVGDKFTKEECVEILDEHPDIELIIVKSNLPGNPTDFNEYIGCLRGAFPKLKILALLPNTTEKILIRLLDGLGIYYLIGNITPDNVNEVLCAIKENRAFLPSPDHNLTTNTPVVGEIIPEENQEDSIIPPKTLLPSSLAETEEEPLPEYPTLHLEKSNNNNVIVVFSPTHSGGTTVASNLSIIAAELGINVGLIDLNIKKPDIITHFNFNHHHNLDSIMTMVASNHLNPTMLISSMKECNGVNVMLGTKYPFQFHFETEAPIKEILDTARASFPLTIVDITGIVDTWETIIALQEADKIIIVLEQQLASIRYYNAIKTEVFPSNGINNEKVDIILSRYHDKASLSLSEVKTSLDGSLACLLKETDEVYTSISIGRPLAVKADTRTGKEYVKSLRRYGSELLVDLGSKTGQPVVKKSLMQRFMGRIATV